MNDDEIGNYIEDLYPSSRFTSHYIRDDIRSFTGDSGDTDLEIFRRFVSNIPDSDTDRSQGIDVPNELSDDDYSSYVREAGRNLANRVNERDERLVSRILREPVDGPVRGFSPTLAYSDESDNMFTNLNVPTNPPPIRSRNTENLSDYGLSHNLFTDCSSLESFPDLTGYLSDTRDRVGSTMGSKIPDHKAKESLELLELVSDNQELEKLNVLLYNALEFAFGFDNSDSLELVLKNDESFSKLWE